MPNSSPQICYSSGMVAAPADRKITIAYYGCVYGTPQPRAGHGDAPCPTCPVRSACGSRSNGHNASSRRWACATTRLPREQAPLEHRGPGRLHRCWRRPRHGRTLPTDWSVGSYPASSFPAA